jgi:hypothetical protein
MVEFPHDKHVSFAHLVQKSLEFGAVAASAGSLLPIDAFAAGGLQSCYLCRRFLVILRNSGIADDYCINLSPLPNRTQYIFASRKTAQMHKSEIHFTVFRSKYEGLCLHLPSGQHTIFSEIGGNQSLPLLAERVLISPQSDSFSAWIPGDHGGRWRGSGYMAERTRSF